jgi:hypothetical protein
MEHSTDDGGRPKSRGESIPVSILKQEADMSETTTSGDRFWITLRMEPKRLQGANLRHRRHDQAGNEQMEQVKIRGKRSTDGNVSWQEQHQNQNAEQPLDV